MVTILEYGRYDRKTNYTTDVLKCSTGWQPRSLGVICHENITHKILKVTFVIHALVDLASQGKHNVVIMSLSCQNDVTMTFRRDNDVIIMSCVHGGHLGKWLPWLIRGRSRMPPIFRMFLVVSRIDMPSFMFLSRSVLFFTKIWCTYCREALYEPRDSNVGILENKSTLLTISRLWRYCGPSNHRFNFVLYWYAPWVFFWGRQCAFVFPIYVRKYRK